MSSTPAYRCETDEGIVTCVGTRSECVNHIIKGHTNANLVNNKTGRVESWGESTITQNMSHDPETFEWRTFTMAEFHDYNKPHRLLWNKEDPIWAQRIDPKFEFEVGSRYLTLGGKIVTITEVHVEHRGYEWVKGDDNICRYQRFEDLGRTAGSHWENPNNLLPFKVTE